jgi:hypothetical protein
MVLRVQTCELGWTNLPVSGGLKHGKLIGILDVRYDTLRREVSPYLLCLKET